MPGKAGYTENLSYPNFGINNYLVCVVYGK